MKKERCSICKKKIKIMIYKSTGVCSENCRKERDNDTLPAGVKPK